jgi:membrane-bound inhibitor of C-type lysozyme
MAALALAVSTSNTLAQPTNQQPSPAVHPAAAPLAVELGAPISYSCGGGQPLTVRYGRLSDGSLAFARLQPPGSPLLTLPQLLSASGARYSDERLWQWWSKGSGGVLQRRDDQGRWQTLLEGCQS